MSTLMNPRLDSNATAATTPDPAVSAGRGWAWAGVLAGLCALVGFIVSGTMAPSDEDLLADNADLAAYVLDKQAIVWIFQVLCSAAALGVLVFAAGLRRKLAAQAPAGSLLPFLSAAGLGTVAVMLLVGGGISTELFWALIQDAGEADPDTIAANLGIFNTMAWVWAGAGLTAGALAVAALRHGALARWIGWVSAVAAAVIGGFQLVPLQYMAGLFGALWMIVVSLGFVRGEKKY